MDFDWSFEEGGCLGDNGGRGGFYCIGAVGTIFNEVTDCVAIIGSYPSLVDETTDIEGVLHTLVLLVGLILKA
jgi:hypothetical protein